MKQYDKYKASGVEWIGDIPEHWKVTKIKRLAEKGYKKFVDGDWVESPYIASEGIKFIQTGNIRVGFYNEKGGAYISENTFLKLKCTEIKPYDVLICRLASPVGRACLAPDLGLKMMTSVDNCILKPDKSEFDNKFISYFLSSIHYLDFVSILSRGSTRDRISRFMLGNLEFASPKLQEQQKVSYFLDDKSQKIDQFIKNKQRLIELLEEEKKTLITHAVTKGINPNVSYKNSGVEWIGDIPEHWEVRKLRRMCQIKRGASPRPIESPKYFDDNGEFGWVRIADVSKSDHYLLETKQILSKLGSSYSVKQYPNDIFLSIAGSVGKAIITRIKCCIHDGFVWFKGLKQLDTEFLYQCFNSNGIYDGLGKEGTQLNLNTETIGNIFFPLPSPQEQQQIVTYIEEKSQQIDGLKAKYQQEIDLINEYKERLIYDTVTGKINVQETA